MKIRTLAAAALFGAAAALGLAAPAQALPGQCWSSPFGGFCDTNPWPDGSFNHCEYTSFGSSSYSNCYQACHDPVSNRPYATDLDQTTPC